MATGVTTEIRIVRCPRCRHLLQELREFTVYQCGGCDAVLQAKSQKTDVSNFASGVQSNGCVQTSESDRVSDDKDLSTTSIDASFPSSCESLPCLNDETERIQSDNQDHLKPVNLPYLNNEMEPIESDDQCPVRPVNSNSRCNLKNEIESIQSENGPTTLEGDVAEEELNDENLQRGEVNEQGISSQVHPCSSPEQPEQPLDFEDTVLEHNPSELNEVLPDSPLYSALNFLADDGSIFSDDEKLDQISDHYRHSSRNIHMASIDDLHEEEMAVENKLFMRNMASGVTESEMELRQRNIHKASIDDLHEDEMAVENKLFMRNMTSGVTESEMELKQRSHRSNLSANNRYDMKGGKQDHDDFLDCYTNRQYRSSQNSNGNVNFAYPDLNDFRGDRFLDPEEEKMNLLRFLNQIQKQLNKSCNFDSNGNRFCSGPSTWKTPRDGILHDSYNSENLGRYPRVGSQSRQHKFSRIPFSGEASSSGSQIDQASYMHPHQHGMYRSMPLHPGLLRFHPNDTSYSYCSSIPHSCLSSQYPSAELEPIFSNQRSKNQEVDEYSRERHYLAKKHFRPIAGGAPFITCYNCFKPLRIPVDFLLFKRRRHKLRCGACLELLEFFLQSKNHMIPCMDPPPSENDEYSDESYEQNRASASHPAADPISCSDDYGLSFGKSYSTEGDPSSCSIVADSRNSSDNPLYHNSEQIKEFGLKQSQRTSKNPVKSHQASGAPLHKLMGYSSIGRVINRSGQSETRVQKRN